MQSLLLGASTTREGLDATNFDAVPVYLRNSNGISNFDGNAITGQWWELLLIMLDILAPDGLNSIFLPSVIGNTLSSIRIAYYGTFFHGVLSLLKGTPLH